MRVLIGLLLSLLLGLSTASAATAPSGGHRIQDDGTSLPQEPILNITGTGATCTDDSGNSRTNCEFSPTVAPSNLYVCEATGAPCNCLSTNAGTSTSATLCDLQDAIAKLPRIASNSTTIHIASASQYDFTAYSSPIGTVNYFIDKLYPSGSRLTIRGYLNATANQFSDVADDSGTSSGSNSGAFPVTEGTPNTETSTLFNDTSKSLTVNAFANGLLQVTGGTGFCNNDILDWYVIISNTATQYNIVGRWNCGTPVATTTYQSYRPSSIPLVSGSGKSYAGGIYNASGVTFDKLKFTAGSVAGVIIKYSQDIQFWRSRPSGYTQLIQSSILTRAANWDFQALARGLLCDSGSRCEFISSWLQNWLNIGVQTGGGSYTSYTDSLTNTGQTCVTEPCTAILNVFGFVATTWSRIIGAASSGALSNAVIFNIDSSSLDVEPGSHIKCDSNASNHHGLVSSRTASSETVGAPNLVSGCETGITVGVQSAWGAYPVPDYSGNTTNETIGAAGSKITSGF